MGYTPPPSLEINLGQSAKAIFPWKKEIVHTVFWIGEEPSANNPVPNHSSGWDKTWAKNYGGYDNPNRNARHDFIPASFTPRQNPFYARCPTTTRCQATDRRRRRSFRGSRKRTRTGDIGLQGSLDRDSESKADRLRAMGRCGPFRTDHWQYVFGNDRPKPNLNQGAGLDVSPAVRDYLGLKDTDVTDWKFVDFRDVPPGPWTNTATTTLCDQCPQGGERSGQRARRKAPRSSLVRLFCVSSFFRAISFACCSSAARFPEQLRK